MFGGPGESIGGDVGVCVCLGLAGLMETFISMNLEFTLWVRYEGEGCSV